MGRKKPRKKPTAAATAAAQAAAQSPAGDGATGGDSPAASEPTPAPAPAPTPAPAPAAAPAAAPAPAPAATPAPAAAPAATPALAAAPAATPAPAAAPAPKSSSTPSSSGTSTPASTPRPTPAPTPTPTAPPGLTVGAGRGRGRGRGAAPRGARAQDSRPQAAQQPQSPPPPQLKSPPPQQGGPAGDVTRQMADMSVAETKKAAESVFQPAPSEKSICKLQPPKSKGPGRMGRPIKLLTNHFNLSIKCREVYHYDVEFEKRMPKTVKRRIFDKAMKENAQFGKYFPVFDGEKNMYTARQLPLKGKQVDMTVSFQEAGDLARDYKLTVKAADPCQVDIEPLMQYLVGGSSNNTPQAAVLALDIVLRHLPSLRFTPVGRSFFPDQGGRTIDIGGGCELWIGYFSTIRCGWKQTRINIDVANKAFHKPIHVMDKMYEIIGDRFDPARGLNPMQFQEVNKQLANLKVEYTRGNQGKRSYRINKMVRDTPRTHKFDHNGRQMTVEQFFSKEYGVQLQYPNLPCLWVGSKNKKIYIPAEVCTVVKGQVNNHKLSPDQVSTMIKTTAAPADVRLNRIREFVRQADFNRDPHNREFGLQVADTPTEVTGRILPAPTLLYNNQGRVQPRDGVWDLRGSRFLDPHHLERWVVLDYARTYNDKLQNFLRGLADSGRQVGMNIAQPVGVVQRDGRFPERVDAVRDLSEIKKQYNSPQLVLVILPAKNKLYSAVKGAGDVVVGQLTSCVLSKTVFRGDRQTATNICQKINAKMGGSNNGLHESTRPPMLRVPTIVFGADVTHPAPDQKNKPSIAAVVASMDASFHARYGHRVLVQYPEEGQGAQELIADLGTAVKELLIEFYKMNNRVKPQQIVFFRDGVSEGQFLQVIQYELEQIKEACRKLEANYQPKITLLVVQKRHHTRLFAQDLREAKGKSKNVPPGTVVDSVIAHPTELDYFLVSHQGIQGTSRPTHYHILHDDSNFTADELEILTYYMCHLFSRCTRSVSNPAPSYYAHLAAFRARAHHDNFLAVNNIAEDRRPPLADAQRACTPQTVPMYYV
ncbi:protein argonaute-2-like [Amphibalanus amphitrite]|uniref:protein argonaute-2-like n=1 Tax=Amphibalanus amphitrite TaxID=1232801 RepID=UPI001C91BCF4|nr:protein argonaute-2-like [Amphibalanus amphitrite]XP_043230774.1 protein argonaute-2-like [Amphibalanus amphitrite]